MTDETKNPIRWTKRRAILGGGVLLIVIGIAAAAVGATLAFWDKSDSTTTTSITAAESSGGFLPDTSSPAPTQAPVGTASPSGEPGVAPPSTPAQEPTPDPTPAPTKDPTPQPTVATNAPTQRSTAVRDTFETVFYAIADVPYTNWQLDWFPYLVDAVGEGKFMIHLGDIKSGGDPCDPIYYERVASVLSTAKLPTFVIPGDNEFNDCDDPVDGLALFRQNFARFDQKHWSHDLFVVTMPGREESFAFVSGGSMFVGLNIVGDWVHDLDEWEERLTSQFTWLTELLDGNQQLGEEDFGAVVIFGHSNPDSRTKRRLFFNPLREYIEDVLDNQLPVIYVSADTHSWAYVNNFLGQPSALGVTIEGGVRDEPVRFSIDSSKTTVEEVLTVERYWNPDYL